LNSLARGNKHGILADELDTVFVDCELLLIGSGFNNDCVSSACRFDGMLDTIARLYANGTTLSIVRPLILVLLALVDGFAAYVLFPFA
jgi:hypothetical protein